MYTKLENNNNDNKDVLSYEQHNRTFRQQVILSNLSLLDQPILLEMVNDPKHITRKEKHRYDTLHEKYLYERQSILNDFMYEDIRRTDRNYVTVDETSSIPNKITVVKNVKDKRIHFVIHHPMNPNNHKILLQYPLNNKKTLFDNINKEYNKYAIRVTSSATAKKNKKQKNNLPKDTEKLIEHIESLFNTFECDTDYKEYKYTFVAQSFAASALYYMVLRSNSICRRMLFTYLLNPIYIIISKLIFARKIHPLFRQRIFIVSYVEDALSKGSVRGGNMLGFKHEIACSMRHRSQSLKKYTFCPAKVLNSSVALTYNVNMGGCTISYSQIRDNHSVKKLLLC